jgi:hypothetical protein
MMSVAEWAISSRRGSSIAEPSERGGHPACIDQVSRIWAGHLFIRRENRHALAALIGAECPGDFERGSPHKSDTGSPVVHG